MSNVHLTPKEIEVIKLLAEEKTTKEISSILHCSNRTIAKHKENLFLKTSSYTIIGIILFGIKEGIIQINVYAKNIKK